MIILLYLIFLFHINTKIVFPFAIISYLINLPEICHLKGATLFYLKEESIATGIMENAMDSKVFFL